MPLGQSLALVNPRSDNTFIFPLLLHHTKPISILARGFHLLCLLRGTHCYRLQELTPSQYKSPAQMHLLREPAHSMQLFPQCHFCLILISFLSHHPILLSSLNLLQSLFYGCKCFVSFPPRTITPRELDSCLFSSALKGQS